jgi:hypothetical protein
LLGERSFGTAEPKNLEVILSGKFTSTYNLNVSLEALAKQSIRARELADRGEFMRLTTAFTK